MKHVKEKEKLRIIQVFIWSLIQRSGGKRVNRFFKWIDLFWTLLIQIVCYVLGWSMLPTITVMQDGIKFRMPYIGLLFQLYDKNPALYIILILILGYVITLVLFSYFKEDDF